MRKLLLIVTLTTLVAGCAPREPVGPAEQIGKGIDQMSKGIRQLETQNPDGTPSVKPKVGEYRKPIDGIDTAPTPEEWESYEQWQRRKGYR